MLTEKSIQRIKTIIEKHCYLKYDEKNDCYIGEIYADYRDGLEKSTIKEIFEAKNPKDKFYEMMDDWYIDSEFDYKDEVIKEIENYFDDDIIEYEEKYEFIEDEIRDWVRDHVYFNCPYDHYLKQDVAVDIIVDTGDENYDYTLNCVYPHYNGIYGETMDNQASLAWLTKQQGYTKTQLNKALRDAEYGESKYLKSVREEINNCTTHMNALTFFIEMSLGELLDLHEKISDDNTNDNKEGYRTVQKRNGKGYIILDKSVNCGLYDNWNGAGSILELELDKDVKLPLKYISSALPDGCRGYGVDDIYGMCMSFWRSNTRNQIKKVA